MIRFASSSIFNSAFFAELGENRQSGQSSGPCHATAALLTETEDQHFHWDTQARQFAVRGRLDWSHNPAFRTVLSRVN
jgi:hypothetical protein